MLSLSVIRYARVRNDCGNVPLFYLSVIHLPHGHILKIVTQYQAVGTLEWCSLTGRRGHKPVIPALGKTIWEDQ